MLIFSSAAPKHALRHLLPFASLTLAACSSTPATVEHASEATAAIVNGTPDTTDKAVVTVFLVNPDGVNTDLDCDGFLIAPTLVVTARQCVQALVQSDAGALDPCTSTFGAMYPMAQMHVANDDVFHENQGIPSGSGDVAQVLVPNGDTVCGADIALLTLAAPLASAPTPLAPRLGSAPVNGETFKLVGYGSTGTSSGAFGARTTSGDLAVQCASGTCADAGAGVSGDEFASTGAGSNEDFGAPAIGVSDGRVIGVAAREGGTSGFYERLDVWSDFLVQSATTAATAGGYPLPEWAGGPAPSDASTPLPSDDAGATAPTPGSSGATGSSSSGGCSISASPRPRDLGWLGAALAAAWLVRRRARSRAPRVASAPRATSASAS